MEILAGSLTLTNLSDTAQSIDAKRVIQHPGYGKEE